VEGGNGKVQRAKKGQFNMEFSAERAKVRQAAQDSHHQKAGPVEILGEG